MSSIQLKDYLNEKNIKYINTYHPATYTAAETAESAHIPGNQMAKTVIVKIDGKLAMVVLPAAEKIDFELLEGATGDSHITLARENEFTDRFHDCETGAMPPLGNIYGMDVYVEEALSQDKTISFNACMHDQLISISYEDFINIVKPKIVRVSTDYAEH